tara:strand:+ start:116 stop:517 length:402 start_codon:yes stop_codon:yes gene_type:complete
MSRLKPYWKNKNIWVCPKHLPSVRIPKAVSVCYFSNCTSVRPKMEQKQNPNINVIKTLSINNIVSKTNVEKVAKIVKIEHKNDGIHYCTLDGCGKIIPQNSKRKKYCSDYCRKKYARTQYRMRMKIKQQKVSK